MVHYWERVSANKFYSMNRKNFKPIPLVRHVSVWHATCPNIVFHCRIGCTLTHQHTPHPSPTHTHTISPTRILWFFSVFCNKWAPGNFNAKKRENSLGLLIFCCVCVDQIPFSTPHFKLHKKWIFQKLMDFKLGPLIRFLLQVFLGLPMTKSCKMAVLVSSSASENLAGTWWLWT